MKNSTLIKLSFFIFFIQNLSYALDFSSCNRTDFRCQFYSDYNNRDSWRIDLYEQGLYSAKVKLQHLYDNLEFYIDIALDSNDISNEEKLLLTKIKQNMPSEKENKNQLQYAYGSSRKDLFYIDGLVKAAATGSEVGSFIYFNLESIEFFNNRKERDSINYADLLTLLIHELGHHIGSFKHEYLDAIGFKVAQIVENNSFRFYHRFLGDLTVYNQPPFFSYHLYKKNLPFPYRTNSSLLIFGDDRNLFSLTPWIDNKLKCQNGNSPNGYEIKNIEAHPQDGFIVINSALFYELELTIMSNCSGTSQIDKLKWIGVFNKKNYSISNSFEVSYYEFNKSN